MKPNSLPVVRIHKNTPASCVVGTLRYTIRWGLTVLRGGRLYKVEIVE